MNEPLKPKEFANQLAELPGTQVDTSNRYLLTCYECQVVKARSGIREPLEDQEFLHAITEYGGVTTDCPGEIVVRYLQQLRIAREIEDGDRCSDCGSATVNVQGIQHCPDCTTTVGDHDE